MDHRAAIRNVRTMVTGAQNAGRVDAAKRARDMGIGLTQVWMATLDMRTRHEHLVLDGQRREIDEPFEVEGEKIKYPGDPDAPAHLVYNCRCTLVQQVKGFEYDIRGDKDVDYSGIEGMTYDEWKEDRREKPNPITLPEEKAEAIKQSYNAEYRKLRKDTEEKLAKSGGNDIIDDEYHGFSIREYKETKKEYKELKKIDSRWQKPSYKKASDEFLAALPQLSKPATIDQAIRFANPSGDQYNCVKCLTAFESMMRGYNLEAKPFESNDHLTATVYDIFTGFAFRDATTDLPQKEIVDYLLEQGDGARLAIGAVVKGSKHLFVAINDGGSVRFCDPQKTKLDSLEYFTNPKYAIFDVRFARIDQLSFTEGIKLFTKKGKLN